MSLSGHRYVARIAPCSSTTADAVHSGATILDERGERVTESIASGGLIWPNKTVPVLLDHDENLQIGFVSYLAERDGWYEATFVLDMDRKLSADVTEYLRVGTPVSLGAKSLRTDEALADLGIGIKRHTVAFLEEVSIVVPPNAPVYRGAKVTRITERESPLVRLHRQRKERELAPPKPAVTRKPTAPAAPGEVFYNKPGAILIRPGIGQVLGVR